MTSTTSTVRPNRHPTARPAAASPPSRTGRPRGTATRRPVTSRSPSPSRSNPPVPKVVPSAAGRYSWRRTPSYAGEREGHVVLAIQVLLHGLAVHSARSTESRRAGTYSELRTGDTGQYPPRGGGQLLTSAGGAPPDHVPGESRILHGDRPQWLDQPVVLQLRRPGAH